ncbi:NUDIX hydrolase [Promicromonospora iranensis]|uniref:8-oxo-dGTP pyrophosphatase MutT (NUDIX family) n=1 Tax=Promicromonospora iranensis TaxID=1105144 RepID=A0ABU2CSP1_9MICO|nr:NUDIX domain-containing protein [Promicromonospora iranensis]MDR7384357.1 8-oxo-dGTP pyrophosphatase MutT (NUDIX family) [Promicromonospora iranensis]
MTSDHVASLHDDASRVLRSWTGPTPEQERLRARYVRHLAEHDDGVLRGCVPDHLTASTLVLSHDGARVLLTLHAKAKRWFQLGGHLEVGDATLAGAAEREAREESGIARLVLDPVPVHLNEHVVPFCRPGTGDAACPVHHLDVRFVAVAAPGAETVVSAESLDLRWWDVDALPNPELTEPVGLALASGPGRRARTRAI